MSRSSDDRGQRPHRGAETPAEGRRRAGGRSVLVPLAMVGAVVALAVLAGAFAEASAQSEGAKDRIPASGDDNATAAAAGGWGGNHSALATEGVAATGAGDRDTAVLWRGFRHAWSYNHRFNRFGSWVNMTGCDGNGCDYTVAHAGASGSGPDVATARDAYTELSARGVGFVSGSTTVNVTGPEKKPGPKDQTFSGTATVEIDPANHPELRNKDTYTALLNGFDVRSQGTAAKLIDLNLTASSVTRQNGKLVFGVEYDLLMDCDSFECAGHVADPSTFEVEDFDGLAFNLETRTGKKVQTVDYAIEVRYLLVGGDSGDLNVVPGNELNNSYSWDNCRNNGFPGAVNSDEFNLTPGPLSDNGFPANRMWCENSVDRELNYTDYWQTATLSGKEAQSGHGSHTRKPGYSVGVVGMKSLSVDMSHEAHFVQYDSIVGGSYDSARGSYDVRALPFFKEWSSRPGMFQKARLSYGFEGEATVGLRPVLLQIREGCKRSFVTSNRLKWKGKGAIPTTAEAVSNDSYFFGFGDTWHGYLGDRGTLCEWPDRPGSNAHQRTQSVQDLRIGRMADAFPLRDGYPPGVAPTGDRIDLWDEVDRVDSNAPEDDVQDPTQLRGRASDRIDAVQSSSKPDADLSKLDVRVESIAGGGTVSSTERIDLSGQQLSGTGSVLLKEPGVYIEPGKRRGQLVVENPVDSYEMRTYVHPGGTRNNGAVGNRTDELFRTAPPHLSDFPHDDYALEIVLSCPDGSCNTAYAIVPYNNPTMLEPDPIGEFTFYNASEIDDESDRSDPDYYEFTLEKFERIYSARIENGQDLELTLRSGGRDLETVPNGTPLETGTTTTDGVYYLKVHGDGVTDRYTLNLTTERISQLYEENDAKQSPKNFTFDLKLKRPKFELQRLHGNRQWCDGSSIDVPTGGDGGSKTGGNVGSGTGGTTTGSADGSGGTCPRHDWTRRLTPQPGYSLDDPDWYLVRMNDGERLNVNVSDEDLGAEIHHNGSVRTAVGASAPGSRVSHVANGSGNYYINVTGVDYVPAHELDIQFVWPDGVDRFELNDRPVTATPLRPGLGTNVNESDLLSLGGRDDDYFAVTLGSGDRLNATIDYRSSAGEINLSLISPSGDVTAATNRSGQVRHRQQRAQKTTSESGRHYVRVSGTAPSAVYYNLTVRTEKASTVGDGLTTEEIHEILETNTWNSVLAPTPEEIYRVNNIGFDIVEVKPIGTPSGPRFQVGVSQTTRVPDGVPPLEETVDATEAGYMRIRHDGDLEGSVRIAGRVSQELLAETEATLDDVQIYRHPGPGTGGEWQRVATEVAETESGAIRVRGTADRLSVYAIAVVPGAEETDQTGTAGPANTTDASEERSEASTSAASANGPGFGVAVTIAAILAALFARRRLGA